MAIFEYQDQGLYAEDVRLSAVAAEYGTPCYVYSIAGIKSQFDSYRQGFSGQEHLICYSVKANSNLSILKLLKDLGAGFDIVSGGELERVLAIGADSAKIVFSGVGKTEQEISRALKAEVSCFNVESESELLRIEKIALSMNVIAPISLRVNPDVDAKTHPYISTGLKDNKFGIEIEKARKIYQKAAKSKHLRLVGIDCHIGSQLVSIEPYTATIERVLKLLDDLSADGISIEHIDLGGGLGVSYHEETPPTPKEFARKVTELIGQRVKKIIVEPGRSIVAKAGVFLTRVEYLKQTRDKNFCIVDGAMNDLIRPSLYSVWHDILPIDKTSTEAKIYDVVGPVCETGDFLGKDRLLAVKESEVLAVMDAGAYGFVMASNYNSRPRAAEVLVNGASHKIIRPRESIVDLFATELNSL